MATVTLGGNAFQTIGNLPKIGSQAPDFKLTRVDLSDVDLTAYKGQMLLLNIFPSIDTSTCAKSVREFNQQATALKGTTVVCISKDLPFAQRRFCGAEGINNVVVLSDFRDGNFGKTYGVESIDGPFKGLHARAVVIIDNTGKVIYTEQVAENSHEPDYESAIKALKNA
ncbi:MAG: thiol peroxidase [Maribacter sp.]|nr:thiol peroxidase [Maribacter sp.]